MITIEEALEGSTPLAQKVRARGPFRDAEAMIAAMRAALPTLSQDEKIATLNAHPRIGADPTRLSARSLREQGADSIPELERLNAEYEQRFGFRFVVFVNGRSRAELVPVLQARLRRTRREELATGIEEFLAIARDRLERG